MNHHRDRQEFIDTINKSPQAVKTHDQPAWLSIFAKYNTVEDPVGSRAHQSGCFDAKSGTRSNAVLKRFYDTYIAPNDISFHVVRDIVCDYHVVRDLHLEIKMSDAVQVKVPMHLLYELTEENDSLKLRRLAAHWELFPMIKQVMGKGLASLGVLNALGIRMLSIQGIAGVLGFMQGLRGIGNNGKHSVDAFCKALNNKQSAAMEDLFHQSNQGIEFPHGTGALTPAQLAEQFSGKLSISKLLSAGYVSSCSFELEINEESKQGVALFEFNAKSKKIDAARLYWE